MKFVKRHKVIELCESVSNELKDKTSILSQPQRQIWALTQFFIAASIKNSVIDGVDCHDELVAFSKLSKKDMMDVYRILAYWFTDYHKATNVKEVRNMLSIVYGLDDSDMHELETEFANRDENLLILNQLLSKAINYNIAFTTFMPHVVQAAKQTDQL